MRMQSQDPPGDYGAPPPKPRFKHDIPIGSATVSGDRQVLVALDAEGCINGWDAATARRLYRRPALDRNEVPQRLTCSPDGRYVAASPRFLPAGIIRVFELAGGREVRRLDRGFSAVFSPDGEFLAATDGDQLRRWALKSGAELPALEPAWAPLKWAAWSPKGDLLAASADASAAVAVWNVATRQRVFPTVAGWNQSATTSLAFSPDGGTLAVGNFWGIKFWNLPGKPLQLFESHEEYSVGQLKFSADGRRMLASVRRRRLLVWDPVSGRPLFTWASYRTEDGCLEVSEGGDVAIWIEKGGIRLERIPKILAGPDDGHVIRGFCFTPEGLLVTGDDRGIVRVWDPATEKEIRRYEVPLERLRFISQGGRWATFGGEKDPVRIWDLSAGRELFQVESKEPVSAIALSPDGTAMALGFVDGSVSIRDLAGAKERARIRQELAGVTAIAWSADGKSLGWGDDV
ncbi:MAG: WD40 repeat domain-containing protein [Planctomycetes bacterium]|nr:WD40 repeat domain-containing protein [Planctomycetota bacterium]